MQVRANDRKVKRHGNVEPLRNDSSKQRGELLPQLMHCFPLPMCAIDLEGRFLFANTAFHHFFNHSVEGKSVSDVFDEEQSQKYMDAIHVTHIRDSEHFFSCTYEGKLYQHRMFRISLDDRHHAVGVILSEGDSRVLSALEQARIERDNAKNLVKMTPAIILALDAKGNITTLNQKGAEILECPLEKAVGRNWFQSFLPSAIRTEAKKLYEQTMSGEFEFYEMHNSSVLTAKGNMRLLKWHNQRLRNKNGDIIGVLSCGQDITELNHAEESLRESENMFRTLAETTTTGIFIIQDTKIVHANRAVLELLGYTLEEVQKMAPWQLLAPEDREVVKERHFKRLSGEAVANNYQIRAMCKDGTIMWCDFTAAVVEYRSRLAIIGSVIDISKRKHAEERLRKSEERFRSFLDNIPVVIALKNREGKYVYANPYMCNLFGKKMFEMQGLSNDDLFAEEISEVLDEIDRNVLDDKKLHDTPEMAAVYDGEYTWLKGTEFSVVTPNGESLIGLVGVDVTEQKRVHEDLIEYQAKLKSLMSELSLAESRERRRISQEIHDTIGQKVALAKFQVQTGNISLACKTCKPILERVAAALDDIGTNLHSTIFDLSNPLLYELGIEAAIESWLSEHLENRCGIDYEFISELRANKLPEDLAVTLFKVVCELATNVVKHARAKKVIVCMKQYQDVLRIDFIDNGIGFKTENMRTTKEGGFGLFNIRQKLEYLDGDFDIRSSPNKGTHVVVMVPVESEARNATEEVVS